MTAWACPGEDWPPRMLVPRPADMARRLRASRSGSRPAGVSPAAWAARSWEATTPVTAFEFLTRGPIASADSVSESREGDMTPQGQPAISALQALAGGGTLTGSWILDSDRSQVELHTRHTWGLRPLHGVFRQVTGNGTVTAAGQVTGILTVAAASIDTKNKMRDKDLRSAKVFDIASHPDITYTVDGMQPASGGVRVTGSLTVRGRTRPLSFNATVSAAADEVRLDAEVPVNRADFGLTYSPLRMASLDNTITVHAVFTRQ
jgi:polyisoprenoid-binding protein YceI